MAINPLLSSRSMEAEKESSLLSTTSVFVEPGLLSEGDRGNVSDDPFSMLASGAGFDNRLPEHETQRAVHSATPDTLQDTARATHASSVATSCVHDEYQYGGAQNIVGVDGTRASNGLAYDLDDFGDPGLNQQQAWGSEGFGGYGNDHGNGAYQGFENSNGSGYSGHIDGLSNTYAGDSYRDLEVPVSGSGYGADPFQTQPFDEMPVGGVQSYDERNNPRQDFDEMPIGGNNRGAAVDDRSNVGQDFDEMPVGGSGNSRGAAAALDIPFDDRPVSNPPGNSGGARAGAHPSAKPVAVATGNGKPKFPFVRKGSRKECSALNRYKREGRMPGSNGPPPSTSGSAAGASAAAATQGQDSWSASASQTRAVGPGGKPEPFARSAARLAASKGSGSTTGKATSSGGSGNGGKGSGGGSSSSGEGGKGAGGVPLGLISRLAMTTAERRAASNGGSSSSSSGNVNSGNKPAGSSNGNGFEVEVLAPPRGRGRGKPPVASYPAAAQPPSSSSSSSTPGVRPPSAAATTMVANHAISPTTDWDRGFQELEGLLNGDSQLQNGAPQDNGTGENNDHDDRGRGEFGGSVPDRRSEPANNVEELFGGSDQAMGNHENGVDNWGFTEGEYWGAETWVDQPQQGGVGGMGQDRTTPYEQQQHQQQQNGGIDGLRGSNALETDNQWDDDGGEYRQANDAGGVPSPHVHFSDSVMGSPGAHNGDNMDAREDFGEDFGDNFGDQFDQEFEAEEEEPLPSEPVRRAFASKARDEQRRANSRHQAPPVRGQRGSGSSRGPNSKGRRGNSSNNGGKGNTTTPNDGDDPWAEIDKRVAEAVAAKVADLDAEMAAMKSERSATARAKHAADALLQEMRRKREEVGEWAAAEKASVEQWCTEQRAALVKERRLVQRQAAGLVIQPPSKKERAEIEALKATVNTLKMEESRCKGRFKLTEQRLKQSLQEAEAKRTELDDQVAFLERERVGVFAEMEALKQALNEANLRAEAAAAAAASSSSAQLGAPSQALPSRTQLQQVQQQQQQRQKLASNPDASRKPPQQPPLTAAPRSNPSHVSSSSARRRGSGSNANNGQASSFARVGVPQPHLPGDDEGYDDRLAHFERGAEEERDQRAFSQNDHWGTNPDFHNLPTRDSLAKQDPFTNHDPTGHYDHHHYSQGSSNSSSSSAHVGGIAAGSGHNYDPTRYGGGDDSAALTSEGGMNPQQEPSTRAKPSQQEQQQPFDSRALDLPPSSTDEHPDQLLPPPPVSSSRSSSRQGTRPPNGPPSNSSKDDASKRATAAPGGSPAPDAQAAQAAPVAAPPAGPGSDKIERKFPDGRVVTWYSNGTHKERRPDGSTCVRFSNGDVKRTSADGAVTYFYESAKTTHSTFPNGDEVFEFPSGQVETHRANGAKEIKFPDGTRKEIRADGIQVSIFPDGVVLKEHAAGGYREITSADGTVTREAMLT